MYIYIYIERETVYVCVYIYIYVHTHTYDVYTYTHVHICTHVCCVYLRHTSKQSITKELQMRIATTIQHAQTIDNEPTEHTYQVSPRAERT